MQDEVKVSQADIDAAQSIIDTWFNRSVIEITLARHRHQAERDTLARMEPVAWMYEREGSSAHVSLARVKSTRDAFWGWTETPLYALPPAPEAGQ